MGVISVAVEHALRLGASAEQILSLVQAMEAELPSLIRLPEPRPESKKISQEDQSVSPKIDTKALVCSLVPESTSAIVPNALVQESICEKRPKKRTRAIIKDSEEFTAFWNACPRRIAKGHARRAWARATQETPMATIQSAMERYASQCRKKGTEEQYIAFPSTWLNQERWLDEEVSKSKTVSVYEAKRTWAEIRAEREKNGDSLVRRDDESQEGTSGPKKPSLARVSDFLPPLPPMDYPQENETTLLAEAIPDEVFIRRDERESETFVLSN